MRTITALMLLFIACLIFPPIAAFILLLMAISIFVGGD